MDAPAPYSPNVEAMLVDVAQCCVRAVHVITDTMEAEQALIQVVTAALPTQANPASLAGAITAGLDIETAAATLLAARPRLEAYANCHEKLVRSLRRTIALHRRLQSGWTGLRPSDTRAAMQKRQVKNAVRTYLGDQPDDALGDDSDDALDDEPAENLFADLNEILDDPGLDAEIAATSVEDVVQRVCRDITVAAKTCGPLVHASTGAQAPRSNPTRPPPDTG